VLLIGSSMVGKTKMAARIIAEEFSAWPVAIPDSRTALADLDASDVTLQHSVIWLDDIDRLIGAGGITDGALRRLSSAGNIIVGTIRAKAYDQFRPSDQLRPPEWDVLSVFEHVFVSRALTPTEQERLAATVDDREIRERIQIVGLGEYVGAAGQIAEALKLGAAGTDPLGYALILAAADWRRGGMTRPVSTSVLAALAEPHVDQRNLTQLTDHDAFQAGLNWATRDINPNVSLLQPAGPGSYAVYDYVLDLLSAQAAPIPDASWPIIMAEADISELVTLGYNAYAIYRQFGVAAQAWRKAAFSGHAYPASLAAVNLGVLLAEQGDIEGAKTAFQRAFDFRDPDTMQSSTGSLGALLKKHGDIEGTKAVYQRAIDSGNADLAPRAAISLGNLLEELQDFDGATAAFRRAIDSGDPDAAQSGTLSLGSLLWKRGGFDGAAALYRRAIDSGHPEAAPRAAVNLGNLLDELGDVDGAAAMYRRAIDSGHADQAPLAAFNLGILLKERGDAGGAKAAYQRAIDSGHDEQAIKAAVNLGGLLWEQGDIEGAIAAYQRAIDPGHDDQAALAAMNLAALLKKQGDAEGAKAAYRQAIGAGDPSAAFNLADLLMEQGNTEGAKTAYRQAIDSGQADLAPAGAISLGNLLMEQGDTEGARTAYQQAIDSGHPEVAPRAAVNLGNLLKELGEVEGARTAYQQAIDSGHPEVAPRAAVDLGKLP
jgi:tetratricopeptide (TPR) repeat protein